VRCVTVNADRDPRIHLDMNTPSAAPDSHASIHISEAALVTPRRLATTAISPERATSLAAQGAALGDAARLIPAPCKGAKPCGQHCDLALCARRH
jgi:hypothetical protein